MIELARPGSDPTGACFWGSRTRLQTAHFYSISVSAKLVAWSSATSFEILLLMADCTKNGSGRDYVVLYVILILVLRRNLTSSQAISKSEF